MNPDPLEQLRAILEPARNRCRNEFDRRRDAVAADLVELALNFNHRPLMAMTEARDRIADIRKAARTLHYRLNETPAEIYGAFWALDPKNDPIKRIAEFRRALAFLASDKELKAASTQRGISGNPGNQAKRKLAAYVAARLDEGFGCQVATTTKHGASAILANTLRTLFPLAELHYPSSDSSAAKLLASAVTYAREGRALEETRPS